MSLFLQTKEFQSRFEDYIGKEAKVIATTTDLLLWKKPSRGSWSQLEVSIVIVGGAFMYWRVKKFWSGESFCCKFIYWDCRVKGQKFCTRSKISLYYSGLFFGKVSPQVFYYETSLFHWFSWVIISCLIYYLIVHDFDLILMFVYLNKIYSQ